MASTKNQKKLKLENVLHSNPGFSGLDPAYLSTLKRRRNSCTCW